MQVSSRKATEERSHHGVIATQAQEQALPFALLAEHTEPSQSGEFPLQRRKRSTGKARKLTQGNPWRIRHSKHPENARTRFAGQQSQCFHGDQVYQQ